MLNIFEL